MRPIAIIGIILIVFGIVALVTGGFSYTKEKDKADLGPIDIQVTQKEHVRVPLALSIVALVGGGVLLSLGWRANRAP
jgi:drug/metabolite transporter (DMT)-like permease